jgi:hypothetical protein
MEFFEAFRFGALCAFIMRCNQALELTRRREVILFALCPLL